MPSAMPTAASTMTPLLVMFICIVFPPFASEYAFYGFGALGLPSWCLNTGCSPVDTRPERRVLASQARAVHACGRRLATRAARLSHDGRRTVHRPIMSDRGRAVDAGTSGPGWPRQKARCRQRGSPGYNPGSEGPRSARTQPPGWESERTAPSASASVEAMCRRSCPCRRSPQRLPVQPAGRNPRRGSCLVLAGSCRFGRAPAKAVLKPRRGDGDRARRRSGILPRGVPTHVSDGGRQVNPDPFVT